VGTLWGRGHGLFGGYGWGCGFGNPFMNWGSPFGFGMPFGYGMFGAGVMMNTGMDTPATDIGEHTATDETFLHSKKPKPVQNTPISP
jgi:hypothetical protein